MDLVTLTRHVVADQRAYPGATGSLTLLLVSVQLGCKFVASAVRKAGIVSLTGLAATAGPNTQGEKQQKLDVVANDIFINALRSCGSVAIMVSEENEDPIIVNAPRDPKYAVVFDPLDGSSNIDAGVSIGTIFGIYRIQPGSTGSLQDVLRPGSEMICAGYCIYGSSTILVISSGHGVNGYTLDSSIGEFILTDANMRIPNRGNVYSINEGNSTKWPVACGKYINSIKICDNPYSLRYIGSMVADVHRTIKYGGIFGYPADKKSKSGKLRLLYECFPMAYIVEQAGGRATTGTTKILDKIPQSIHERSSIFLGSSEDVLELEKFYKDNKE